MERESHSQGMARNRLNTLNYSNKSDDGLPNIKKKRKGQHDFIEKNIKLASIKMERGIKSSKISKPPLVKPSMPSLLKSKPHEDIIRLHKRQMIRRTKEKETLSASNSKKSLHK